MIEPQLAVALGATAARGLLSRAITIGRVRGEFLKLSDGIEAFVTVHPSSLLRAPDEAARAQEYAKFVHDMRLIARHFPASRGIETRELRSRRAPLWIGPACRRALPQSQWLAWS